MEPMPREMRTHRIPRKPRRDSIGSVKRSAETRADANCHRERRRCLDRTPLPRRDFQSPLLWDRSKSRRGSRYDPRPRWSRDTHPTELRTAVAPACLRDNPRDPTGSSVRAPKDLRHRRDFDARRLARARRPPEFQAAGGHDGRQPHRVGACHRAWVGPRTTRERLADPGGAAPGHLRFGRGRGHPRVANRIPAESGGAGSATSSWTARRLRPIGPFDRARIVDLRRPPPRRTPIEDRLHLEAPRAARHGAAGPPQDPEIADPTRRRAAGWVLGLFHGTSLPLNGGFLRELVSSPLRGRPSAVMGGSGSSALGRRSLRPGSPHPDESMNSLGQHRRRATFHRSLRFT